MLFNQVFRVQNVKKVGINILEIRVYLNITNKSTCDTKNNYVVFSDLKILILETN